MWKKVSLPLVTCTLLTFQWHSFGCFRQLQHRVSWQNHHQHRRKRRKTLWLLLLLDSTSPLGLQTRRLSDPDISLEVLPQGEWKHRHQGYDQLMSIGSRHMCCIFDPAGCHLEGDRKASQRQLSCRDVLLSFQENHVLQSQQRLLLSQWRRLGMTNFLELKWRFAFFYDQARCSKVTQRCGSWRKHERHHQVVIWKCPQLHRNGTSNNYHLQCLTCFDSIRNTWCFSRAWSTLNSTSSNKPSAIRKKQEQSATCVEHLKRSSKEVKWQIISSCL